MQHCGRPRAGYLPSIPTYLALSLSALLGCSEQPLQPLQPLATDGPANKETIASVDFVQDQTSDFPSDVARAWFDLSYELVRTERWSPPVAARFWSYSGVAVYEAVRPGMPSSQSLAGQLNGLATVPRARGQAYHWPTVANAALSAVFTSFYAGATQGTRDQIVALYDQLAAAYRAEVPPGVFTRSERFGAEVAQAILDWAATDGFAAANNCSYTPPVGEGMWVRTPPNFAPPLQPCWGELRTSVVGEGAACDPGAHPEYSEAKGSDFYAEGFEVFDTVNHLTPEQLAIAIFWADSPGQTGTPGGHWIRLLGQFLDEQGMALDVAAEAYARVGLAENDAFICCWFTKYEFTLLRPITYIQHLFDSDWVSPVVTPAFPEYTSGHSTQSGAVAEVLTEMFGDVPFVDHTHDDLGLPPRSFASFRAAAEEAAISRLYGGIHYRSAIEHGLQQGTCIGQQVSALVLGSSGVLASQ